MAVCIALNSEVDVQRIVTRAPIDLAARTRAMAPSGEISAIVLIRDTSEVYPVARGATEAIDGKTSAKFRFLDFADQKRTASDIFDQSW
ncbi:hypothetical protein [Ruegeria arenilitoris]|uniref:hypothetical protein n=1 Tax=Ruegeria arenilitoris TaxID=1173585 RepID=UPI001481CA34|nr:hypothetical protein [Ruegeria arenilitoris]